jgi:integrase
VEAELRGALAPASPAWADWLTSFRRTPSLLFGLVGGEHGRAKRARALVFPGPERGLWTKTTYDNWRRRAFDRARAAARADEATPYALRHSFASLLLHEGRSVVYVARQLGHDARLTLTTLRARDRRARRPAARAG